MKPPIYDDIVGYTESSVVRFEGTVYSNVSDYLTPVSSGGTDTMNTTSEHQTVHQVPEVMLYIVTHATYSSMHSTCIKGAFYHSDYTLRNLNVHVLECFCGAEMLYV